MNSKEQEQLKKMLLSVEKEESANQILYCDQEHVKRYLFDSVDDVIDEALSGGELTEGEEYMQ